MKTVNYNTKEVKKTEKKLVFGNGMIIMAN